MSPPFSSHPTSIADSTEQNTIKSCVFELSLSFKGLITDETKDLLNLAVVIFLCRILLLPDSLFGICCLEGE